MAQMGKIIIISSSHLADLKSLTHDVLYETYRTEKLSRTVHADTQYVDNYPIRGTGNEYTPL
jgi:septin family protein